MFRSNLDRLNKIIAEAKRLKDMAHESNGHVAYDTDTGKCEGMALMSLPNIAILDAIMWPGTKLKPHLHEKEEEILVVYEGDIAVFMQSDSGGEKDISITDRGIITILPGTTHVASSINGCKLIGITIPAAPGYPKKQ